MCVEKALRECRGCSAELQNHEQEIGEQQQRVVSIRLFLRPHSSRKVSSQVARVPLKADGF